ncbi:MAG: hypothetical protein Q7S40_07835 [Opitutaceae bacterium]|nr:hypothetical protein [Opitutaceae bacterium]
MGTAVSPRRRLSLTKSQLQQETGASLLSLLSKIAGDGRLGNGEVRELRQWLDENRGSDIPAIGFLVEIADRVLADRKVTGDERIELQLGIEKVLPVTERGIAREARETAEAAFEGPTITTDDLKKMVTSGIRMTPPRFREWRNDPITEPQRDFIKSLGGKIRSGATKGEASDLISSLLGVRPITSCQQMVLRFWARDRQPGEGPREISEWMDNFYIEDPDRKAAWELFKCESEDDGFQGDPTRVPVGVGPEYLARVKAGGADVVPKFTPTTPVSFVCQQPVVPKEKRTIPILVGAIIVIGGFFMVRSFFSSPPLAPLVPVRRQIHEQKAGEIVGKAPNRITAEKQTISDPKAQIKASNTRFVQSLKISGVIGGKQSRAVIDGKLYSVGDVIDSGRGLLVHGILEQQRTVSFMDTTGEIYSRKLD